MFFINKGRGYSLINIKTGESTSYTLIGVAERDTLHLPNSKQVKCLTLRRDTVQIDPKFKQNIVCDGYAVLCVNEDEQSYTYSKNEKGKTIQIFIDSNNIIYNPNDPKEKFVLVPGRREYHELTKNF